MVPLHGDHNEKLERLSDVLQHYMLQSEQLTPCWCWRPTRGGCGLADPAHAFEGRGQPGPGAVAPRERRPDRPQRGLQPHRHLASSLTRDELLTLDVTHHPAAPVLGRKLLRFEPWRARRPRFACTCSRERVANMLRGLGAEEAESILAERSEIEVVASSVGSNTASMRWMRRRFVRRRCRPTACADGRSVSPRRLPQADGAVWVTRPTVLIRATPRG